jgi:SAM-dependent methyltransferase
LADWLEPTVPSGTAEPTVAPAWVLAPPAPIAWWLWTARRARTLLREPEMRRYRREWRLIESGIRRGRPLLERTKDTSERVVEIPWVLSQVNRDDTILDIGTAYAPIVYFRWLHRVSGELHCADMSPVHLGRCHHVCADVRSLPLAADSVDTTICISTIEHIGLDSGTYVGTAAEPHDEDGDLATLKELARLTRPGGQVLLTVPAGREADYDWFRQYSLDRFERLAAGAGLAADRVELFAHEPDVGWAPADPAELASRDYQQGAPYAAAIICARLLT